VDCADVGGCISTRHFLKYLVLFESRVDFTFTRLLIVFAKIDVPLFPLQLVEIACVSYVVSCDTPMRVTFLLHLLHLLHGVQVV
jgi:hypothetical protein